MVVKLRGERKERIDDVTGCVPHGQFTLILIHHLDGNAVQFGLADDAGAGFHRQ